MRTELIAVTGGIGSGKTIVSKVLTVMGYEVYDCDSRAKVIMDHNRSITERIALEIDPSAITDGRIDRPRLSQIVFSDRKKLETLNRIVHGAVREDLARWRDHRSGLLFVETAILYESELDRMVDHVWEVIAPTDMRVDRVMSRSGLKRDEVLARIKAQDATIITTPHHSILHVINDGMIPILPQIETAIERLKTK